MKKTVQRDLFPGALEMMILRILRRQPSHQRLLKAELVKAEWGISSTNRRVRIYKLTRAGAKHLEREVSSFERMLEGITRVLAPGES
jgi:DNA-binding PadR family transcriptional regulator